MRWIFEKNVPSAQTTRLASFGPVLVIAIHPDLSRVVKTDVEPKNH